MKRFFQNRENLIAAVLFAVTMITATAPLISRYCINGHDIEYHLLRIESLKEGILAGHPFMKVNMLFFGGAGYASSLFYSDLFMHIPALLRVMHVSIGKSFHIYTAIIFILCYLSTYYCVWKMSLSKFAATVAAILLTLCPYHMDDMLVRTACGENAAFIFLPFVVYGIFNVLYEDMNKPWAFGLGYAGLIVTHPATCILAVCIGLAVFLIYIRTFAQNPRIFIRLCVVSLLALLVTSYQWMPMIEQFADAKFYVSNNWTDLLDASVGFSAIASSAFPCVGFVLFALMLPRIFLSRKDHPILAFTDLITVFACIFAIGATNIMPWERVAKYFGFLQFPWRMFIMTSVFLAMADAIVLKLFIDRISESNAKRGVAREFMLVVIMALTAELAITHQNENSMGYYDYSDDYYNYKPYTVNVIAGEWLPVTVTDPGQLLLQSEQLIYDDGTQGDFTREKGKLTTVVNGEHDYVDVPFVYYKGYSAVLTGADGSRTKLEVSGDGANGLCRVKLDKKQGTLVVHYSGTILQYAAVIISHLFLLLIIDLCYLKIKYKKKLSARAAAAGANLGKIAGVIMIFALSSTLCACSVNLSNGGKNTAGFTDPDEVLDLLRDRNGYDDEADWIDGDGLVVINYSRRGYDSEGSSYAVVIDESSGEQVISVISVEEASERLGESIPVARGLYADLMDEEIENVKKTYRTDSLQDRIMHETDALLCLEMFTDVPKRAQIESLAKELGEDILSIPDSKITGVADKYNIAAVLAKMAYAFPDWDRAKLATDLSEMYFRDAESADDAEGEPVAARMWAAAELYRVTGSKTYRSVVDAIAMDIIPRGFTYDEPGSYGVFAYLMSPNPTNMSVCTNMMDVVFLEANNLIKKGIDSEFTDMRVDTETYANEEKKARRMLDEAFLVTLTNYVSISVEYEGFVQDRLNYIFGANLSGVDFTESDNALADLPKLFVLAGLCR